MPPFAWFVFSGHRQDIKKTVDRVHNLVGDGSSLNWHVCYGETLTFKRCVAPEATVSASSNLATAVNHVPWPSFRRPASMLELNSCCKRTSQQVGTLIMNRTNANKTLRRWFRRLLSLREALAQQLPALQNPVHKGQCKGGRFNFGDPTMH